MLKADQLLVSKIEKYIEGLLENGKLKEGDRLLPEKEIARMFKASSKPVRNALQKFVNQGIIRRTRGKGSFVQSLKRKNKTTDRIGVFFCYGEQDFLNNSFFGPMVEGILREANRQGKIILLHSIDSAAPLRVFNELIDDVDGFIMVDVFADMYKKMEPDLKALPKPVVILNYEGAADQIDTVVVDSYANAKKMVRFLVECGHRRIAFVYRWSDYSRPHPNIRHRIQGYQDGLAENGIAGCPELVVEQKGPQDDVLAGLWRLDPRPTAVFCCDDELALIMLDKARAKGIGVPEDLTVVGHDGLRESANSRPPLTTTSVPLDEMGRKGVQRLVEMTREKAAKGYISHTKTVLACRIMERGSHKPPGTQ